MKKSIYTIALLVVISLTLTACTKKGTQDSNLTSGSQDAQETVEYADGEENINANILDLMKLGKSVKCTYELQSEGATTKGETYVSNGKTRSEITIDMEDGTKMDSYTISEGDWMYMWSSESDQGTKISLKEMESTVEDENIEDTGNEVDYNNQMEKIDYKCSPWIADDSKFEVPTNIEFVDFTEMMQGYIDMSKNLPATE